MRILNVSNHSASRCGISGFGLQVSYALRRAGADVTDWDGTYPTIYAKVQVGEPAYLPADAVEYDVIHYNWHPATLIHYRPEHLVDGPLRSIYLNDLPPWSGLDWTDRCQVRVTSEPHALSTLLLPYPIIDWVDNLPPVNPEFTVGWSGVRGDGAAILRDVCGSHNWLMNESDPNVWLSIEDEIRRLARSHVNVCWYHEGRGISSAATICLASGRPLVINYSPMLNCVRRYRSVIDSENLDETLMALEARSPRPSLPPEHYADLTWATSARQLLAAWKEAL